MSCFFFLDMFTPGDIVPLFCTVCIVFQEFETNYFICFIINVKITLIGPVINKLLGVLKFVCSV